MLLQFKFKNHKCFYDETILDLTATQEKQHINTTIDINGNKILPIIEIHGANAAGKSSVLDALYFMCLLVKNSNRFDINDDLPTNSFAFVESRKINSEYEVSLAINGEEYRYGFALNKKGFDEEWLYKKKFKFGTKEKQKIVFERSKNKVVFGKNYPKYQKTWNLFEKELNTHKLLVLNYLAIKEEKGILRDVYNCISRFTFKIDNYFQKQVSIDILEQNNKVFNEFQNIINEFDPCLKGIIIDKVDNNDNKKTYKISGIHKNISSNNETFLPLNLESAGTIKIFEIMPSILINLEKGGVLCIDELDTQLHPLLFRKIVNMYKDRKINKNNAQLIFTTHSTLLFNSEDLRRDELYLVDKDLDGKSKLYSLSEFRNLRVDADYEKKYLTGQFGGIPYNK